MLWDYFIRGILNYQFCSFSLVRKTSQAFVSVLFFIGCKSCIQPLETWNYETVLKTGDNSEQSDHPMRAVWG